MATNNGYSGNFIILKDITRRLEYVLENTKDPALKKKIKTAITLLRQSYFDFGE